MVIIFLMLIGVAYAMMTMFPTEEIYEKQAEECRENMELVKAAVNNYQVFYKELPAEGKVSEKHPLVTGGYISRGLKCPSTGRYYIIKYNNGNASVVCDSKLKGHKIK